MIHHLALWLRASFTFCLVLPLSQIPDPLEICPLDTCIGFIVWKAALWSVILENEMLLENEIPTLTFCNCILIKITQKNLGFVATYPIYFEQCSVLVANCFS